MDSYILTEFAEQTMQNASCQVRKVFLEGTFPESMTVDGASFGLQVTQRARKIQDPIVTQPWSDSVRRLTMLAT